MRATTTPRSHRSARWNRYQRALAAGALGALLGACGAESVSAPPRSPPAPPPLDSAPILVESTLARSRPAGAPAPDYGELARTLETHLYRDIVERWYPLGVDLKRGGFGPHFRADWSPSPADNRFLVFQARMTWVAAEVALRSPERRERFSAYALHGLDWLERRQWDAQAGGFYWDVTANGCRDDDGEARLRARVRDLRRCHGRPGHGRAASQRARAPRLRLARRARARSRARRVLRSARSLGAADPVSAGA